MRVGLVVYGRLDETSGGFLYDRRLVEYLRDRGDTVKVVSLPWRTYPRHLLDNVDRDLERRLETTDVDVWLQDELCHPSLVWMNRRLDDAGVPIASIVHHLRSCEFEPRSAWRARLSRWVERRYLETVDGAICSSEATHTAASALTDRPRFLVAHPPGDRFESTVSKDAIRERAHRPGPLRIVFVGNVIPRKGLHTLVEGLARLPRDAWQLTVVGSVRTAPRYVTRVRRTVDRLDVRDNVDLTGRLPDDELRFELERSHLLAVPSTYEGFGIVYLEGMGFGLPALATTAGGADEIVEDERNGFLVSPGDPDAIARAIETTLDDRDRLARMGIAARERYDAQPEWTVTAGRIRTFLGELIEDDRG